MSGFRMPQGEQYLRGGLGPLTERINDGSTIAERIQRSIAAGAYDDTTPARIAQRQQDNQAVEAGLRGVRELRATQLGRPAPAGGMTPQDLYDFNDERRKQAEEGRKGVEFGAKQDAQGMKNAATYAASFYPGGDRQQQEFTQLATRQYGNNLSRMGPDDAQRIAQELATRRAIMRTGGPNWWRWLFGDDYDIMSMADPGESVLDKIQRSGTGYFSGDNMTFTVADQNGQQQRVDIDVNDLPRQTRAAIPAQAR